MYDDTHSFHWVRDSVLSVLRSDTLLNGRGRRQVLSRTGHGPTPQKASLIVTWTGAPGFSPDMLIDRFVLSLHDAGMPSGSVGSRHVLDHATAVLRHGLIADNGNMVFLVRTGRWVERSAVIEHRLELLAFEARVPRAELDGRAASERGVPGTPWSTAGGRTEYVDHASAAQFCTGGDKTLPKPRGASVQDGATRRPGSQGHTARQMDDCTGFTSEPDSRASS